MKTKESINTERYKINTLEKAFDLLEILAKKNSLNLTELSAHLEQPKSSLYRIITTLELRGYISRDETNDKYCLGTKTLELTKNFLEGNTLLNVSKSKMDHLVQTTGESVNLGILKNHEILYVASIEGSNPLKFTEVVGAKAPFHATAIGKAITANLPLEQFNAMISDNKLYPLTENTICSMKQLMVELQLTKERGIAIDNEEVVLGAKCIAAPIFNMFGKVIAAISVSGSKYNFTDENLSHIITEVKGAAEQISKELGHS
ncbi:IclR family transcriptional regulator [Fictibacillus terranigra]|uniref:IclR family transcriptional regulator n=1 Tax=Fictibacillus terranigra TaxID=3058424 RepID=A0ABT8EDH9_9BACL|nr:IclR family transcriptional regulator [Fictibacillus sp. CENA-BCM004]MDN4075991.1 IclR family transcriptional regulator [Fictibacillus sp. CENA-BCM004]